MGSPFGVGRPRGEFVGFGDLRVEGGTQRCARGLLGLAALVVTTLHQAGQLVGTEQEIEGQRRYLCGAHHPRNAPRFLQCVAPASKAADLHQARAKLGPPASG